MARKADVYLRQPGRDVGFRSARCRVCRRKQMSKSVSEGLCADRGFG